MLKHLLLTSLCAVASLATAASEWSYVKTIPTMGYTPYVLAVTPTGDVVTGAFNTDLVPGQDGMADVPVIYIKNPLSENPEFFRVCSNKFPAKRGYSGVAVDEQGNFYVSADTGEARTSWIRKFKSNGQPDSTFGVNGEISDSDRFLGLALSGKYLITTGGFAKLKVYNSETGKLIGQAPVPPAPVPTIRDISVDPATQNVYGVDQGAVWVWEGGTFDQPTKYTLSRVTENRQPSIAGEGIGFDPVTQRALIPFQVKSSLTTVGADKSVQESVVIEPATKKTLIADAVLLADGKTLFVSDLFNRAVQVMHRGESAEAAASLPALEPGVVSSVEARRDSPATDAGKPAAAPTDGWVTDYDAAQKQSKAENKPLLLYARAADASKCQKLESEYLKSPEFLQASSNYVRCWLDVGKNGVLAQQLGIFRVPHIAIYDPNGNRRTQFPGVRDTSEVTKALK